VRRFRPRVSAARAVFVSFRKMWFVLVVLSAATPAREFFLDIEASSTAEEFFLDIETITTAGLLRNSF